MPTAHEEDFNLPLWKIVLRHLLRPRTWIYPIIVLIVVYFLLPRLARQTAPTAPNRGGNGTVLFGGGENPGPSQSTDAEGNIHRFAVPGNGK